MPPASPPDDDPTRRAVLPVVTQPDVGDRTQTAAPIPLRERFARLRATHPLPPATGKVADKAFFDDLCGDL